MQGVMVNVAEHSPSAEQRVPGFVEVHAKLVNEVLCGRFGEKNGRLKVRDGNCGLQRLHDSIRLNIASGIVQAEHRSQLTLE